jgi:hypothetical protein
MDVEVCVASTTASNSANVSASSRTATPRPRRWTERTGHAGTDHRDPATIRSPLPYVLSISALGVAEWFGGHDFPDELCSG